MMKIPELLCPAGSRESLEAALHFGADAVYGGMKHFGLRAYAGCFDGDELRSAVQETHAAHARFYVTMNIYPFDDELEGYLAAAREAEADYFAMSRAQVAAVREVAVEHIRIFGLKH